MSDDIFISAKVESNVDRLSVLALQRLLRNLLESILIDGMELLRVNAPKDTGTMSAHAAYTGPEDVGEIIRGAIGIPPIPVENRYFQPSTKDLFTPGAQDSANYPEFVDRGTGIFGPAHAPIHARRVNVMHWETDAGGFFRSEVAGQRPQHFLLATYEEIIHTLLPEKVEVFKERVRALASDPIVI